MPTRIGVLIFGLVGLVFPFSSLSAQLYKLLYDLKGATAYDNFGGSVAGVGDLNGDGKADFIVGAPVALSGAGVVYVYSGADGAWLPYSPIRGAAIDQLGWSVAGVGDLNSDGTPDFIIGAPGAAPGGPTSAGSAYVYSGADGTLIYQKDGIRVNGLFGWSVAGVGDVGGKPDGTPDGIPDFIIGAPGIFSATGEVYVYSGADGALFEIKKGATAGDYFGSSVAGVGDVNSDSRADYIIGAPDADPDGRQRCWVSLCLFRRSPC